MIAGQFLEQGLAIADVEARKVLRDPTELFSRAVQPVLWLVIFGRVFGRVRGIPTGHLDYTAFLAPGILAQSILFSSIFYGIGVIWERDLGIVHKLLVSPAHRSALVLGKALAAGLRGLAQAVLIYVLVCLMGIGLRWSPQALLGVVLMVAAASALFSTFSLMIACIVKTRERFMGIGQLLTMPLFFASNAIYPIALMPGWLRIAARLNPLTYVTDALRGLMIAGGGSVYGLRLDFAVIAAAFLALTAATSVLYPTIIR
ncbi:MAG: ABC transporter permease [Elusimicrobia bacterium]|nr:ABC transporter permease [Elusimicrobiota bacterium]MDE2237648.1 ABC transporter permease [Elusimicrobiota bacterium]MDE2425961.1 ABC transporter permease [Elusimicrobiota bacterium]